MADLTNSQVAALIAKKTGKSVHRNRPKRIGDILGLKPRRIGPMLLWTAKQAAKIVAYE